FVPHEMKSNDGRHGSGDTIAEMTTHRVAHHLVQFFNRFALRGNRVSQRGGNVTAVHFIFLNFKNDFAHHEMLLRSAIICKLATNTQLSPPPASELLVRD